MTGPIHFLSFVEDEPTKHVVQRLFVYLREHCQCNIELLPGYPDVLGGFGNLKGRAPRWIKAAEASGAWFFVVTDLDRASSPNDLGRDWFGVDCLGLLPRTFLFRIAVREVESWIMADRLALSGYLGIAQNNLPANPDELDDPKSVLLSTIRAKCRKKIFLDMLPKGRNQHVGVAYNERLCAFVDQFWDIDRAMAHSPSLARSVARMASTLSSRG